MHNEGKKLKNTLSEVLRFVNVESVFHKVRNKICEKFKISSRIYASEGEFGRNPPLKPSLTKDFLYYKNRYIRKVLLTIFEKL